MMATDAVQVNRYWLWGGGLLVGSAVVTFGSPSYVAWFGSLGQLALVVGVLLFAFGGGVSRNLFRGGRLGTVMLVLFAAWEIVTTIIRELPLGVMVSQSGQGVVFGSVQSFIGLAITVILVVQIGRADHLPKPWRWAPLWAIVAQTAVGLLTYTVVESTPINGLAAQLVFALSSIVGAGVPIFVGILAIVLAWGSTSTPTVPNAGSGLAAADSGAHPVGRP